MSRPRECWLLTLRGDHAGIAKTRGDLRAWQEQGSSHRAKLLPVWRSADARGGKSTGAAGGWLLTETTPDGLELCAIATNRADAQAWQQRSKHHGAEVLSYYRPERCS